MTQPARAERAEDVIQILILLLIGGMAGAASFTHVHDWTMHNSPPGTGGWFGWANAIISELTPTAAGLEIRRRKRHNRPIAYPMTVLVAAATLSLTAQVAQAKPGLTGWLVAALPALAFLALSKIALSRASITTPAGDHLPAVIQIPDQDSYTPATTTSADTGQPPGELPSHLLTGARMAAFAYQQETGQPITADALAAHLDIPPTLAGTLISALDGTMPTGTPPPVTTLNGTGPDRSRP